MFIDCAVVITVVRGVASLLTAAEGPTEGVEKPRAGQATKTDKKYVHHVITKSLI
jgi:hypothetical protein